MTIHVVQSPEWGEFKTKYGTPAVKAGDTQYTKHKIPGTPLYYAYAPKVDPAKLDFGELKSSLTQNSCIAINFDVPNVLKGTQEAQEAETLFEKTCTKAAKVTFAVHNVLLDITSSEEKLLANMHSKQRYNIKYAQKKGVEITTAQNETGFDIFFNLLKETADRQKYYIHPKTYYQLIWETLAPHNMCHIVTASYNSTPLASWMLFVYDNVLYYPYGGSSEEYKNLQASSLVGWEAIKLGKILGCTQFDMWGACDNLEDETDSWWGFTNFKLKFGGKYVEYMDSYDLVINKPMYNLFNLANKVRWQLLTLRK